MGGLIGGCVGDAAAKRWPLRGRIAVTQFSVSIGIPFACLVFKVGGCCLLLHTGTSAADQYKLPRCLSAQRYMWKLCGNSALPPSPGHACLAGPSTQRLRGHCGAVCGGAVGLWFAKSLARWGCMQQPAAWVAVRSWPLSDDSPPLSCLLSLPCWLQLPRATIPCSQVSLLALCLAGRSHAHTPACPAT